MMDWDIAGAALVLTLMTIFLICTAVYNRRARR